MHNFRFVKTCLMFWGVQKICIPPSIWTYAYVWTCQNMSNTYTNEHDSTHRGREVLCMDIIHVCACPLSADELHNVHTHTCSAYV